jgi:hypothetical protein
MTGKLKCPICTSPNMGVIPIDATTALLSCEVCGTEFEIPIVAARPPGGSSAPAHKIEEGMVDPPGATPEEISEASTSLAADDDDEIPADDPTPLPEISGLEIGPDGEVIEEADEDLVEEEDDEEEEEDDPLDLPFDDDEEEEDDEDDDDRIFDDEEDLSEGEDLEIEEEEIDDDSDLLNEPGMDGEAPGLTIITDAPEGITEEDLSYSDEDVPDEEIDLSTGGGAEMPPPPAIGGRRTDPNAPKGFKGGRHGGNPGDLDEEDGLPAPRRRKIDLSTIATQDLASLESQKPKISQVDAARGYLPAQVQDMKIATFYRRIGDVMIDNAFDREVGGKRSGRIVPSSEHRVVAGSSRIFSRKEERKNKHYNILFVIDGSGSMDSPMYDEKGKVALHPDPRRSRFNSYHGEKRGVKMDRLMMAAYLTRLMIEGLQRHGMDFGVLIFGRTMEIIKPFEQRHPDLDKLEARIEKWHKNPGSGATQVWQALHEAETMLKGREGHSIIIFLTDGGPNDCAADSWRHPRTGEVRSAGLGLPEWWKGSTDERRISEGGARDGWDGYGPLRKYGEELQRRADIISIGIADHSVKEWAPNPHVIHTPDEFMTTILTETKKFIRRG